MKAQELIDKINKEKIVYLFNSNNNSKVKIALGCKTSFICKSLFELKMFTSLNKGDFISLSITYDVKNNIENLESNNHDEIGFPLIHASIPKEYIEIDANEFKGIENEIVGESNYEDIQLNARISKETYIKDVKSLIRHIQAGNIYEVNYCQEYFAKAQINPFNQYCKLNAISKAPFSCFVKIEDKYVLSASPERFVKKEGNRILSQPIKGTSKRSEDQKEDKLLALELETNTKERAENIMIVDLVRNDLSKISEKASVNVEELCKIYSFETVHQMISTISADIKNDIDFSDLIKALFPMGSMTGAPKVSAMQLIEQHEKTKRGIYSGTIGYIKPNGDFDLNVIIRTLVYNETASYLSSMVGGAITSKSDPEKEYEECLIKLKAVQESLKC